MSSIKEHKFIHHANSFKCIHICGQKKKKLEEIMTPTQEPYIYITGK